MVAVMETEYRPEPQHGSDKEADSDAAASPLDQPRQSETAERPETLSEGVGRPELGQPREEAFSSRVEGDPYLLVEQAFAAKVAQLQGAGELRLPTEITSKAEEAANPGSK